MCNRLKIVLAVILLLFSVIPLTALDNEINFDLSSSRTSGYGGIHAALTDDISSIFSNPAGFNSTDTMLSLTELTILMSGPIFDISNIVIQALNEDITSLFGSSQVQNLAQSLYAAMNVVGPLYFGYIGKGLGFGIFNDTDVTFTSAGPLRIDAIAGEQITLAGGYAFSVPFAEGSRHSLDIGLLLKGSLRGEVELNTTLLELPTLFTDLSLETLSAQPFRFITAVGIDVGVLYSLDDVFTVGLVGKNPYTPTLVQSYSSLDAFLDNTEEPTTTNDLVPFDLTFGVMYEPRLGQLERFINNIRFMADYRDIIDFVTHRETSRNPVLHVSLGLEVVLLEILSIRGGFQEGLFAGGLGIDLSFFRLNIAMFGSELSSEPGLRSVYNAQISLEFRL